MKKKLFSKEEVKEYMDLYNLTETSAKEVLSYERGNSDRIKIIRTIKLRYNCSWSVAEYAYYRMKKGKPYIPHLKKNGYYDSDMLKDFNIQESDNIGGWDVYYKGKLVKVYVKYQKTVTALPHLYVNVKLDDNKVEVPLAVIVYVKLTNNTVPNGYVVDHENNNSFDNRLVNLKLRLRADNTKKDSKGHNQYTYKNKKGE